VVTLVLRHRQHAVGKHYNPNGNAGRMQEGTQKKRSVRHCQKGTMKSKENAALSDMFL